MNTAEHYLRPGTLNITTVLPLSLYVHLPWCLQKCPYCDFNSHERPGQSTPEQTLEIERQYIDALQADLEAALPLIWGRQVISVFIGGGTPSLFSPRSIERLIAMVRARLMLMPGCEITLEANPGTFEKERFHAFRDAGVTRLSVGVQSFDNAALKKIGRVHDGEQAWQAMEEASKAFDTFNLDLMYALPGQDVAQLEQDLATALSFHPPHLSVYHLTIEPNTRFSVSPPSELPDEDMAAEMLDVITAETQHSMMNRYEVSAYARQGHECIHNHNYWTFGDYLGIGAGAHSKLSFPHRVIRQTRWRDPQTYLKQTLENGQAISNEEEVTRHQLAFEFMLNALRLREGFALNDFTERTGLPITAIAKSLDTAESRGLIERDWQIVKPTAKGFDFLSNLQEIFLPN